MAAGGAGDFEGGGAIKGGGDAGEVSPCLWSRLLVSRSMATTAAVDSEAAAWRRVSRFLIMTGWLRGAGVVGSPAAESWASWCWRIACWSDDTDGILGSSSVTNRSAHART